MTHYHGRMLCPICGGRLASAIERAPSHPADHWSVNCAFCGTFVMTGDAIVSAVETLRLPDGQRQTIPIAHHIRRMQANRSDPAEAIVTDRMLNSWWNNARLPTPAVQADNLVRLLGDMGRDDPGQAFALTFDEHGAIIGAQSTKTLAFTLLQCMEEGAVDSRQLSSGNRRPRNRLTLAGWRRYEDLQRGDTSSTTAFMAMKFGDPGLDAIVTDHFRPAVEATGFRLKRLDDEQPAGLIDDHLRVEIKRARFLIADLSHGNNGAYWEAGYAEGLGKPVIYTCERSVFDDKTKGTHFDTNHHLTVIWDKNAPETAARKLKDTIRATLPDAKMSDT